MKEITHDAQKFFDLREFLLNVQSYEEAVAGFKWPRITKFNWALDYFDVIAEGNQKPALIYADTEGNDETVTFDDMMKRSNRVANFLNDLGLEKGDRVMLMMDTSVEIYELFLGIMKAGGAIIPASTLLSPADVADRIVRGDVKFVVAHSKYMDRVDEAGEALYRLKGLVCVKPENGECQCENKENIPCWVDYNENKNYEETYESNFITFSSDILFLFFTSGTTSKPKLVMHPHHYPVGHLTTMYWLDLKPDDVHYNISSPGWAKFVWSSFIAPWNAGCTAFTLKYDQFDPDKVLDAMEKYKITSLCAPLSVWKLFGSRDFSKYNFALKKMVSAGEPVNPEISKMAKELTGVELREGYGQTETTAMIATFPGMKAQPGSIGKVAPGYEVKILNTQLDEVVPGQDGQICCAIYPVKPMGLLTAYEDPQRNKDIFKGGWYLTGDTAYMDEEGYVHFVGRVDDVFKSLDYRISPFEVESEIIENQAVLEVGVIPTVDEKDRIVPKAFIVLNPEYTPNRKMALEIFRYIRDHMAPYKRPRSIEFMEEFPKTISSKVMRKDLRAYDEELRRSGKKGKYEFFEKEFAKELNLRKRK
jgi:acetyl-CoA synthetase